jgi:hypothetical protein
LFFILLHVLTLRQARFLISPGQFREYGERGSPAWRIEYEKYKRLLWDSEAEWVDNLLRDLTTKLFGTVSSRRRQARALEPLEQTSEYDRLLAATRNSRRVRVEREATPGAHSLTAFHFTKDTSIQSRNPQISTSMMISIPLTLKLVPLTMSINRHSL